MNEIISLHLSFKIKMKMRAVFYFGFLLLLQSCAFNGFYYFPDKSPVVASNQATEFHLKYDKEKTIHSVYFKKENPKASIFILHGNGGSLTGWQSVAEMLWNEGYQTYMIDYPGYGNSEGKAKHKNVISSAQLAFEHFNNLPAVQGTKKIIMGFSLGGNLALKIGADNQEQLDAMVIEGAFNNYREIGIDHTPKILRFAPYLVLGSKFKGEEEIKKWNKPLLVVHSTDDNVCPYWMGKEIYENADSDRKEMWTIKGPHIAGFANYSSQYLMKISNLVVD